jgi:ferredoxin-nitrite reductase
MDNMERAPSTVASPANGREFTLEQKQYLAGFFAAIAPPQVRPNHAATGHEQSLGSTAQPPIPHPQPDEPKRFGTPVSDLCKQELWKRDLHGLDAWDRLLEHANQNRFPDEADNFRFRYHGLFYVGPAQNAFMLRCRIPAGELSSAQVGGLADISDRWGDGKAAITTRSNIQIRGIAPKNAIHVLTALASCGLTSRGSGVDNVRNITASPTAGIDPQELIDTRPFALALHHYILNQRELYDLPRKFNVAFEGGGAIDTVADTNDIGFVAVRIPGLREELLKPDPPSASATANGTARSSSGAAPHIGPGIYFRIQLAGITGHKQFAIDSGLLVRPENAVTVASAMIRVFIEHGDRTDRRKARLKYLIDKWGVEQFLRETQKKLSIPLVRYPLDSCQPRHPSVRHGHIGVYRQKQAGRNYIGAVVPVGVLTTRQMRRVAHLAENYGSGHIRLTPWQNFLIPDVPDGFVETVKRQLIRIGLHYEATHILGGLVACTGNKGCKWSSTDTKGHALALGQHLSKRVPLDQPLNLHVTGCPNSCAQHYMGDIGLQGVKTNLGAATVEAYHIVFGGGYGTSQAIGKQVFTGIPFSQVPSLLERVLQIYQSRRAAGESFVAFTRRHTVKQLQELFSQ